jgi:hypothetical protein
LEKVQKVLGIKSTSLGSFSVRLFFPIIFLHKPLYLPDSCKTDTGKPPFKASEGGCFENLRVSEDITLSEFQQGKGTRVPIRPKVRLEAFPNGLPMSVSSKVYATLRFIL